MAKSKRSSHQIRTSGSYIKYHICNEKDIVLQFEGNNWKISHIHFIATNIGTSLLVSAFYVNFMLMLMVS